MIQWRIWLERQSSKQEVVGSSPTVGKNIFRFFRLPHSSTKPIQMKSAVRDIHLANIRVVFALESILLTNEFADSPYKRREKR